MAAPFAYEQPTLKRAWDGFRRHLLTVVVIILMSSGINLLGFALGNWFFGEGLFPGFPSRTDLDEGVRVALNQLLQTPFAVVASLLSVLLTAVPALYYETGRVVTLSNALELLAQRPLRYIIAGILATLLIVVGLLLCLLPGLAVAAVMPVYINRIFVTDQPIVGALIDSFQAVYGREKSWRFLFTQVIAWLLVGIVFVILFLAALCVLYGLKTIAGGSNLALLIPFGLLTLGVAGACLIGWFVLPQMAIFYVQNAAYRFGILS